MPAGAKRGGPAGAAESPSGVGWVARPESSMGVACVGRLANRALRKAAGRATLAPADDPVTAQAASGALP